jgi:hypothetical protein
MGTSRRRWRLAAGAGLVLLAAPIGLAGAQDAGSGSLQRTFDASAAAYGFDSTISNPSIPIGLVIQGAGPTAQTQLSSLGQANSFASFPYPGDTVAALPGTVSGLFGGLPLPEYPLIVSTRAGEGRKSANYPGIALGAQSSDNATDASAVLGTDAIGFDSDARIRVTGSEVTAEATTELRGITLGNLVRVTGVESFAKAVLGSDGKVTTSSSMSIGRISVPGLKITIPSQTPEQIPLPIPIPGLPQLPPIILPPVPLPLGGTTIEAPDIGFIDGQFAITLPFLGTAKFAVPAEAVLAAFKAAGVDITFQAAQVTDTGVVAPVLSVKTVVPAPPDNQIYSGPTPVTFALGRTSASIQGPPPVDDSSAGVDGGSSDFGSGGVNTSFDSPALGGDVGDFGAPSIGSGPTGTNNGSPTLPGVVPAAHRSAPLKSVADIYLVLLGVGLVGTTVSQTVRYVGVRAS